MNQKYQDALISSFIHCLGELCEKGIISLEDLSLQLRLTEDEIRAIIDNEVLAWDRFVLIMKEFCDRDDLDGLLKLFNLDLADVSVLTWPLYKSGNERLQKEPWTISNYEGAQVVRGIVPVPVGLRNYRCPKCNSVHIRGALIMPGADEEDPNIICMSCGYWWD